MQSCVNMNSGRALNPGPILGVGLLLLALGPLLEAGTAWGQTSVTSGFGGTTAGGTGFSTSSGYGNPKGAPPGMVQTGQAGSQGFGTHRLGDPTGANPSSADQSFGASRLGVASAQPSGSGQGNLGTSHMAPSVSALADICRANDERASAGECVPGSNQAGTAAAPSAERPPRQD